MNEVKELKAHIYADKEAIRLALKAMNRVRLTCECLHHFEEDKHVAGDKCPPLERFNAAFDHLLSRMVVV